ncbi:hypothetical protein C0993_010115, partial [Termitomyces sp. T159_Od127]
CAKPCAVLPSVTTHYQPLGLRPGPGTPTPPNPPPRLSQAWTTIQPTTLATPGHHHSSPPPATATTGISLAITAMTATSAPAPAIPGTPPTAAPHQR